MQRELRSSKKLNLNRGGGLWLLVADYCVVGDRQPQPPLQAQVIQTKQSPEIAVEWRECVESRRRKKIK